MARLRSATLALTCLAVMAVALAQDGAPGLAMEAYDELDPVLIVGERTPPLWKLSRKGHVLWILGTFRPQPRNIQLGSQKLNRLIGESQDVILPGFAYVASRMFGLMPEVVKSDRNPGGATLKDLLPAEPYAKWLALRQKYSSGNSPGQPDPKFTWGTNDSKWVMPTQGYRGGDGIDSLRPTFAWEALRRAAMDRNGLANYDIEAWVSNIAKQHNVPVRRSRRGRELMFVLTSDPLLEEYGSKQFNVAEALDHADFGDLDCLASNLELLEPVMENLKVKAAAWSRGDMQTFRIGDNAVRMRECVTELIASVSVARLPGSSDAPKARERYYRANRESVKEVQDDWLDVVRDAVKKNAVTFSVLPIDRLLAKDGYLEALRDNGFVVEVSGQGEVE